MSAIEDTIKLWVESKKQLACIEKKSQQYRDAIEKYMNSKSLDTIDYSGGKVKRSEQTREFITKKELPSEVWKKYSKESIYYVYKITKK